MTHNKKILADTLQAWLPLAAAIVIMSGLVYCAVQQNYRQTANDPQVQIVQDVADAITKGAPPESIVPPTGTTDITKSLSPFVLIYDESGKQLGSSAILNGKNPEYPKDLLDKAKQKGEARVTWQPEAGVRVASVVSHFSGKASGFVVVGRSLKEVDKSIQQLAKTTALATALALIVTLLIIFFLKKMENGRGRKVAEVDIVVTEK